MGKKPIAKYIFVLSLALFLMPLSSYALVINSPQNGTIFKEGDAVELIAELTPDDPELIVHVRFVVSGLEDVCIGAIRTHPKYKCRFTLPPGSPKTISIMAHGLTPSSPLISQEVNINVGLPASVTLQALKSFTGNKLYFTRLGQNNQLYIQGIYSDGVVRDIENKRAGTTYTTSNERVVTVNADGLATAVAAGTAQITVKNGDKKLLIDVVVKPKR